MSSEKKDYSSKEEHYEKHSGGGMGTGGNGMGTGGGGMGMGTGGGGMGMGSTGGGGGMGSTPMSTGGTATNPATGETRTHETQPGAAVDQGWQDLKSKVPGTKEHEATRGPTTGTGTGY